MTLENAILAFLPHQMVLLVVLSGTGVGDSPHVFGWVNWAKLLQILSWAAQLFRYPITLVNYHSVWVFFQLIQNILKYKSDWRQHTAFYARFWFLLKMWPTLMNGIIWITFFRILVSIYLILFIFVKHSTLVKFLILWILLKLSILCNLTS